MQSKHDMINTCSFDRLHTTRKTPSTHTCVMWWHCRSSCQSIYQTPSTALKRKPPTKTTKPSRTSLTMYIVHGSTTTSSMSSTGLCLWRPPYQQRRTMSRGGITGSTTEWLPEDQYLFIPFWPSCTLKLQTYHSSSRWSSKVNCRDTKDVTLARYRVNCLHFGTSTVTTSSRHPGYWKSVPAFMVHHRSNFVDNEHCVCVTMNFLCNVCVVFLVRTHNVWYPVTCIYYVYFIQCFHCIFYVFFIISSASNTHIIIYLLNCYCWSLDILKWIKK